MAMTAAIDAAQAMRDNQDTDSGSGSALLWSPALIGAGIGAKRVADKIREGSISASNIFGAPTGSVAYAHAVAESALQNSRVAPNYTGMIDEMAANMSWRRLPDTELRHAVNAAMRQSLTAGRRVSTGAINELSKTLLGAPAYGTAAQPDIFGFAAGKVKQFGDPGAFYNAMQRYIKGTDEPGFLFGRQEIDKLSRLSVGRRLPKIGEQDWRMISEWMRDVPSEWSPKIGGVMEYPGGVRMAKVGFTHPVGGFVSFDISMTPGYYRKGTAEFTVPKMMVGDKPVAFGQYQIDQITKRFMPDIAKAAEEQRLTQGLMRRRARALEMDMARYMTWTPGVTTPGQQILNQLNAAVVAVPELAMEQEGWRRHLNVYERMGTYFQQGFTPPKSATQMKAGKVIQPGGDLRRLWAYGSDFPFERLPGQMLREWSPTPEAAAMMRTQAFGPRGIFRRDVPFMSTQLRRQIAEMGQIAPQLGVAYAVPGTAAEQTLKSAGLAAEEMMVRKRLMPMFGSRTTAQYEIALREYLPNARVKEFVKAAAEGTVLPMTLEPGEAIGREMASGRTLSALKVPGVSEKLVGVEIGAGAETAKLLVERAYVPKDLAKLFGQFKVTTRARSNKVLNTLAERMGLPFQPADVDAFAYADHLLKNRSLLKQQMVSGLTKSAGERIMAINQAMLARQEAERAIMAATPGRARSLIKKSDAAGKELQRLMRATNHNAIKEIETLLRGETAWIEASLPSELAILRKAKQWGLELGPIGGMVPAAIEKGLIPGEEGRRILTEVGGPKALRAAAVWGVGTGYPGDFRWTGGGGVRATMEPRGFMQLMQQKWPSKYGNVGELLAGEMARSMYGYGPELQELTRTLRSMSGKPITAAETIGVNAVKDAIVRDKGYLLDIGMPVKAFGGASQVYVPGTQALRRMDYFRAAQGEIMASDMQLAYRDFVQTAKQARAAKDAATSMRAMEGAATELSEVIMRATGQAMTGVGGGSGVRGALRGRMAGSKLLMLSSVDPAYDKIAADTALISRRAGREMYEDLFRNATTRAERRSIAKQWSQLIRGGRTPAAIGRDPLIGPYSVQQTFVQLSNAPGTYAEHFVRLPAHLQETLRTGIGDITFDVGAAAGTAADYDADRLIVKAIGDQKVVDAMRDSLNSGRYRSAYRRFAAEAAMLKKLASRQSAGAIAGYVTDVDKMILGATKMRMTAVETASISAALSEAKLSVATYAPKEWGRFSLMAEAMEQQLLSAKHLKDLERRDLAARTAQDIRNLAAGGGAEIESLARTTEQVFGPELGRGIQMGEGAEAWTLRVKPQEMWGQVREAMALGEAPGGVLREYRAIQRQQVWRADVTVGDMYRMIEQARVGSSDMMTNLAARGIVEPRGPMQSAASKTISKINRGLKEGGMIAKTWGKPALYGLAATAALAMLAGGPDPQPMEPPVAPAGASRTSTADIQQAASVAAAQLRGLQPATRDMRPETLQPQGTRPTVPQAPRMATPKAYATAQPPLRQQTRAVSDASFIPSPRHLLSRVGEFTQGKASVYLRDDRRKMSSQDVAEALEGF